MNADVQKNAKRQEVFFVMSLHLSDHEAESGHETNIASSSIFLFDFARILSLFSLLVRISNFGVSIIPFALVDYETGYSQLGAPRFVGYLPSHIQRALME